MSSRPNLSVSDVIIYLSLCTIVFPMPLLIDMGGTLIFAHYMSLSLAIPAIILRRPIPFSPAVLATLCLIFISTLVNLFTASMIVAVFHGLHLLAIWLLSSIKLRAAVGFAKFTVTAYVAVIFLAQLLILLGLEAFAEEMLILVPDKNAGHRISAFATEPAFAGLIILILTRFLVVFDPAWLSLRRMYMIFVAVALLNSLFAFLSAILIALIHFHRSRGFHGWSAALLSCIFIPLAFVYSGGLIERSQELEFSMDLMGLGSGTIRLLPYIYLFSDLLSDNVAHVLLFGAGADAFQAKFFSDVGQFYTAGDQLSGHTAAMIYNYGVPFVLSWFFWNRPSNKVDWLFYFAICTLVFLNTGVGSYLFLILGIFGRVEQRNRLLANSLRN